MHTNEHIEAPRMVLHFRESSLCILSPQPFVIGEWLSVEGKTGELRSVEGLVELELPEANRALLYFVDEKELE